MKSLWKPLGLSLVLAPRIIFATPEDPAALLFQEFASKCASQGTFTQRALADSRSLQNILVKIQNDDECKDILPVVTSLTPLIDALPSLEWGIGGNESDAEMLDYIDQLTYEMSITADVQLQSTIAAEIASSRFRLLQSREQLDEAQRLARVRATQAVLDYMSQLSKFSNAKLCFERNKTLPFQLAAQMASLAGLFMGPFINQAIVIGGALIKNFFELISESSLTNKIKKYRDSQMWMGLSCAMESLEDTACDILDQRELIRVRRAMSHEGGVRREWEGYDLFTREYPILQDFFQLIKTGVGASSTTQGYEIQGIKLREARYSTVQFVYDGMLRDTRKQLGATNDVEAQRTIIRNICTSISHVAQETYRTDVAEGNLERILLWLRIGNAYPTLKPQQTLGDLIDAINSSASEYPDDPVWKGSLALVEDRLKQIRAQAQQQLEIDKKLALNLDAERTMVAFSRTQGYRSSPENILARSIRYLERLQIDWTDNPMIFQSPSAQAAQLRMLSSTKDILASAFVALTDGTKTDAEKLNSAFEILSLADDEFRVANRIADIVELDVDVQIRLGALQESESLQTVLRIASSRLVNLLTPHGTISELEDDLDNAEPMATQNLSNFLYSFDESYSAALDLLYKDYLDAGGMSSNVQARNYAKLCVLALNFPKVPKVLQEKCMNQVYGYNETGPIEMKWDMTPLTVNFAEKLPMLWKERACSYRKYREQKKMIELFKSRSTPFLKEYRYRRKDGTVSIYKGYKELVEQTVPKTN